MRKRDWRGALVDIGIVAWLVALPVSCFSTTAALALFGFFAAATLLGTATGRRFRP